LDERQGIERTDWSLVEFHNSVLEVLTFVVVVEEVVDLLLELLNIYKELFVVVRVGFQLHTEKIVSHNISNINRE
jgi:hypothetical protein